MSVVSSNFSANRDKAPVMPQFIIPIEGTYLKDYFLLYYVDWGKEDIHDYKSGKKTYFGHQGTDFIIRNFAQMDAGVNVLAADDGVVTYVFDKAFDRNKTADGGGLGNYITILHANKFYTHYGHLKKDSARVIPGEKITKGQVIAQVGSSGHSSDPHLHFEIWYNRVHNWDPFTASCGDLRNLWVDNLPYVDHFGVIDHDFIGIVPSLNSLKERLPSQRSFYPNDKHITFWMQGYGVSPGDESVLKWYDPNGKLWFQFEYKHKKQKLYYYWWTYIDMPPAEKAGTWMVRYFVNKKIKIEDTFTIFGY